MKAHEHFAVSHTFHKAAGKEFATRAEACGGQDYEKMIECDKNLSKLYSDYAAHFKSMHDDAANKAAIDELAKGRAALEPTRISAVTPNAPGVTAVPRAGQRAVEKTVDPEFVSLVSSGDDRSE